MNITVIGCGRWGSFIAWYLNKVNHNVTLYGRENSQRMKQLIETRNNGLLTLDNKIKLSTNLGEAIESEAIVISINSQA